MDADTDFHCTPFLADNSQGYAKSDRHAIAVGARRYGDDMRGLDDIQQRVLALPLGQHRAIVGAPGSGKTRTLIGLYTDLLTRRGLHDHEVLVLGASRLVAKRLREQLDDAIDTPAGAPRARTSSSLAHAIVGAFRRSQGEPPFRLLTGATEDELIDEVFGAGMNTIDPEVREDGQPESVIPNTPAFRNQFRELLRVMSDYSLRGPDLERLGAASAVNEWIDAAPLVAAYQQSKAERFPLHLDAAEMQSAAAAILREVVVAPEAAARIGDFAALRAVLIDDAQELTQSALNLISALAARGVTVWAFGDPDISTGAFQGAAQRALSDLGSVLGTSVESPIVLPNVYRHGAQIRELVRRVTDHIGTSGLGAQRAAQSIAAQDGEPGDEIAVQFAKFASTGEAAEAIAHRLRARHLGITQTNRTPLDWSSMAVVCRTRIEVQRLAQQLAAANVPTDVRAGGRTLSSERIVRDLLTLVQLSQGWVTPEPQTVEQLLLGPVGGLDPLGLKRLKTAMLLADARNGSRRQHAELLLLGLRDEQSETHVDTRQGTAFRRLAKTLRAGQVAAQSGGDLSEVLWAVWDSTGLSSRWERMAFSENTVLSDEAHTSLDAVMALFFAVTRFEEQELSHDREGFVRVLLESALPEDSLARTSARDAVVITTPQGMIGRSAKLVVVTQLHEGIWPNLKSRGTLLQLEQLTHVASGQHDLPITSRKAVLHDELRLFAQALSRAESELLCVAVQNDDIQPSVLFSLGESPTPLRLPSSRLTLRGMVAALRRKLNEHPGDTTVAKQLALLARAGVPGAHPDEWYGIEPLSSTSPLHDLSDPNTSVSVSPSRLEAFETCPLNWAISHLGGDATVSAAALGTLIHQAMETADSGDYDALMTRVDDGWSVLSFDAQWQQERSHRVAERMVSSLSQYLTNFAAEGGELLGAEQRFELNIGKARVRGTVDRVELRPGVDGAPSRVLIVDLKTQRYAPTALQVREHPQLAVYQLAVHEGALPTEGGELAGAALLLVHPKAVGQKPYKLPVQDAISGEERELLIARIEAAAQGMSQASFSAEIEHHCASPYAFGNCALHVIRAVSFG